MEGIRRRVKCIIDGDTFIVSRKINGLNRIKLAGLDNSMRSHLNEKEATNRLKRLIGGQTVVIFPVRKKRVN